MAQHDMIPRDLFGRVPALVRMKRTVIPTKGDSLAAGERVHVVAIEPDGLGIGVKTYLGHYVSLHHSEYEVLQWADAEPQRT